MRPACRTGRATAYPHPNQFLYNKVKKGDALQVSGVVYIGGCGGETNRLAHDDFPICLSGHEPACPSAGLDDARLAVGPADLEAAVHGCAIARLLAWVWTSRSIRTARGVKRGRRQKCRSWPAAPDLALRLGRWSARRRWRCKFRRGQLSNANCSGVSFSAAAAVFSSRCEIDAVPGIGSITGDLASNHASRICAAVASTCAATRFTLRDPSAEPAPTA